MKNAKVDPSLLKWSPTPETHFQFERIGFFVVDPDSRVETNSYVFNLTVTLKDSGKPAASATAASAVPSRSRKEEQEKQLAEKLVSSLIATP